MTAPLVPRKRASKPKVRTGCDTCKKVGPYRGASCVKQGEGGRSAIRTLEWRTGMNVLLTLGLAAGQM